MASRTMSVIPGGIIQFIDLSADLSQVAKRRLFFREQRRGAEGDEETAFDLFCLEWDDERQEHADRSTGKPGAYDYEMDSHRVIDQFVGQWIPLPFLRVRSDCWPDRGPCFQRGPSNWARLYIAPPEGEGGSLYRMVMAIDTVVEGDVGRDEIYGVLTEGDVSDNGSFALAHHERDNAWFLNSGWIDGWLRHLHEERLRAKRRGRPLARSDGDYVMQHIASYLTLLDLLHAGGIVPTIKVIDPSHYQPVEVDLVLDLGNARTCGILIENRPNQPAKLTDSYILQIRDLSQPSRVYSEPFQTRVEFSEADFGSQHFSARSGRETDAFVWPSVVRVGPEAMRLALGSVGAEGHTGMSSPKRYLWDERAQVQQWHYNAQAGDGGREPPVTRGVFVQYLNQHGTPLYCFDEDPRVRRNPVLRRQNPEPAFEAHYSRSSLMMFLLSELILQALVTIGTPSNRVNRENPDLPRRLRSIVLSVPTAMPLAERNIYRRWVDWAVGTVWRALGWERWYVKHHQRASRQERPDYRLSPQVRCDWDEATCSQLVYLYNELREKYQGDAHHLFRLFGRDRGGGQTLRLASIDVGGGTTDLSISTYTIHGSTASTARLASRIDFREGFNKAGDDILCAVIEDHILPALQSAIAAAGVPDAKGLLGEIFGRDIAGQAYRQRNLRGQFVRQALVPIAVAMLQSYEELDPRKSGSAARRGFADFFTPDSRPADAVIAYFEDAVRQAGGAAFSVDACEIETNGAALDRTVHQIISPILANLCEIVHLYGCDLLLLTGRPSRLPAVQASVLAKLPLPPDRIIAMHEFRIGRWYPFSDYAGRISDPKTTVVVGAILCALADGHLEGFSFDTSSLTLTSTARFVGEMDDGQLRAQKVWFTPDLQCADGSESTHDILFSAPIHVGFRQLPAERWTTTPFYMVDFASSEAKANSRGRLPYKVKLVYRVDEIEEDNPRAPDRDEGALAIEEIIANDDGPVHPKDLEIRLQTMRDADGYWLDTGILNIV